MISNVLDKMARYLNNTDFQIIILFSDWLQVQIANVALDNVVFKYNQVLKTNLRLQ